LIVEQTCSLDHPRCKTFVHRKTALSYRLIVILSSVNCLIYNSKMELAEGAPQPRARDTLVSLQRSAAQRSSAIR